LRSGVGKKSVCLILSGDLFESVNQAQVLNPSLLCDFMGYFASDNSKIFANSGNDSQNHQTRLFA
jgi:hypothetical protein